MILAALLEPFDVEVGEGRGPALTVVRVLLVTLGVKSRLSLAEGPDSLT